MKNKKINVNVKKVASQIISFNPTFGSDPELMLWDKERNKIVSSIPVLKNDKYDPINLGDGIKMYADNVLVEFAFPPVNNKQEFIERFRTVFQRGQEKLGNRFEFIPKAAHVYDEEELQDEKAKQAGCDPSFNAYEVKINDAPQFEGGLRSGSFHIHVGHKELTDFNTRLNAIKLMDIFVGLPSVIFDKDNSSLSRRKLYGKASEHRPTPYGLEFRVLPPFALRSPKTTELVFDLTEYALSHIKNKTDNDVLKLVNSKDVIKAINNCDKILAKSVLIQAKLPVELMSRVQEDYNPNFYTDWKI